MGDLISRAALLRSLNEQAPKPTTDDLYEVNLCIINAPAVDAVPVVHGRWIKPVPGDGEAYCSNCKHDALPCGYYLNPALMKYYETAYCPNCGAKMDGERRNEDATD